MTPSYEFQFHKCVHKPSAVIPIPIIDSDDKMDEVTTWRLDILLIEANECLVQSSEVIDGSIVLNDNHGFVIDYPSANS